MVQRQLRAASDRLKGHLRAASNSPQLSLYPRQASAWLMAPVSSPVSGRAPAFSTHWVYSGLDMRQDFGGVPQWLQSQSSQSRHAGLACKRWPRLAGQGVRQALLPSRQQA